MAWLLLLLLLLFLCGKVIRWPAATIKIAVLLPIVGIIYLATKSLDAARFATIITIPVLLLVLLRLKQMKKSKKLKGK